MSTQRETGLSPEGQAILQQDFGKFSNRLAITHEVTREHPYTSQAFGPDRLGEDPSFRSVNLRLYPGNVLWFNEQGNKGYESKQMPLGTPHDYLAIRDSYSATKAFVDAMLDKGRIDTSTYGHGGEDSETNPSDYIQFLYSASTHEPFRRNLEQAVVELTTDELLKPFEPVDYQATRARVETTDIYGGDLDRKFSWVDRSGLDHAISSLGLEHPSTPQEAALRDRIKRDLEATATLEEGQIAGKSRTAVHFEKLPEETKKLISEFTTDREATRIAAEQFAPQFNRLVGLLELVARNGTENNGFSSLYPILLDTIHQGIFSDTPDLRMGVSSVNLENHVILALSAIQQEDELRDFWLDRIGGDPHRVRAITAILGLLSTHKDKESRKAEIPAILSALLKRGGDLDIEGYYPLGPVSHVENLQDSAVRAVLKATYPGWPFYRFDQTAGALDVIKSWHDIPTYHFYGVDRYTTNIALDGRVVYDAERGKFIVRDTGLDEKVVKDFIEREGFVIEHLWNRERTSPWEGLKLQSVVGRTIRTPEDTKIIEGVDQSSVGSIEGVMMIDGLDFAFIFNPKTEELMLSEDLEERNDRIPRSEQTWQTRKRDLDKLPGKIPAERFVDLNALGYHINTASKKAGAGKQRWDFDGRYSKERLYGKISGALEEYIVPILKGRLVNTTQDLVT